VLVPVVVRDKQGRAVNDLKKEDFQVFDNDKQHPILGLTVEKRGATEGSTAANATGGVRLQPSGNAAPPSSTLPKRIVVFMFDDMHLSFGELTQAQRASGAALDEALADFGMAAVVSTSGKTNSGLTRDRAKLQEALASLRPQTILRNNAADCPDIDYYRADLIENKHDSEAIQDAIQQVYICNPGSAAVAERIVDMAAKRTLEAGRLDIQATYDVIEEFVRRMAPLPGQRTMVLVSPGFISITQEALTAQSRIIDLAAQSDVIIDTLDARGLYTTEDSASDNVGGRNAVEPMRTTEYRREAMSLAENPMVELADGTGGTYFHHNNDLDAGLRSFAKGPEYVYVLELSLDDVKLDGSYHRLKVKVDREGVQLQARRGYHAPKPESKK
jgi:VWFA-related protein